MDFISLALAALKLFNWITGQIDENKIRADERRKVFQDQLLIANKRFEVGARVDERIAQMTPEERNRIIGDDFIESDET